MLLDEQSKKKSKLNPSTRFSTRADNYCKYRPRYPLKILSYLKNEHNLTSSNTIADIGSGTGFLSKIFLDNGNDVYGVEPNDEMRHKGEQFLKEYDKFHSISGKAEFTTLKKHSIDLVVIGQAYHWFNPNISKMELIRILKKSSFDRLTNCVLVWNTRKTDDNFNQNLEQVMKTFSIDYAEVKNNLNRVRSLFGVSSKFIFFNDIVFKRKVFSNHQLLSFEGLLGRICSSSYMIDEEHRKYNELKDEVFNLFNSYQKNNFVTIKYDLEVFTGLIT